MRSFLKSRRARIDPEKAGFHIGSRRRVPGLRREEVAALANLSVDYYTQLEQGRALRPSDVVLAALGDALGLDTSERSYLARLMRHDEPVENTGSLREGLRGVVEGMRAQGAFIVDHRMDVLAVNRIADALMGGSISGRQYDRNLVRYMFEDPDAAVTHPDWDEVVESMVATLRYGVTRWQDDVALDELIRRLRRSDRFATLWGKHDVTANTSGTKRFQFGGHVIEVHYEVFVPRRIQSFDSSSTTRRRTLRRTTRSPRSVRATETGAAWVVTPTPPSDTTFCPAPDTGKVGG